MKVNINNPFNKYSKMVINKFLAETQAAIPTHSSNG